MMQLKTRYLVLLSLVVTASLSLIYVVADALRSSENTVQVDGATIIVDYDYTLYAMRTRIALGLIVAAVTFLWRRKVAIVLSAVALTWVVIEYIRWLVISLNQGSRLYYSSPGSGRYILFLSEARYWDVVALIAVLAILSWEIKTSVLGVKQPAHSHHSSAS